MEFPAVDFFQVHEIASILRVDAQSISRQIKTGKLRSAKCAGRIYVHKTDAHRFLAGLPPRSDNEALEEISAIQPSWTFVPPIVRRRGVAA